MAVICYPHLSGKISMKDGTPVNTPDDLTGKYKKFKYICMAKLNNNLLQYYAQNYKTQILYYLR